MGMDWLYYWAVGMDWPYYLAVRMDWVVVEVFWTPLPIIYCMWMEKINWLVVEVA